MKKLIKVTKAHIAKGNTGNGASCPVALAIRDVVKSDTVYVSSSIRYDYKGYYTIVAAPARVVKFVAAFDKGKKVKPFNFYLDVE